MKEKLQNIEEKLSTLQNDFFKYEWWTLQSTKKYSGVKITNQNVKVNYTKFWRQK